ncbi:hypothetical protein [Thiofilum flexile]|uniref:hypothetical protein n=1 Tax=Thiofilum flexile TaxID=125627 RepID=UPI00036A1BBE|nr:hypothetical protein [Thiofilum flexile]
MPKQYRLIISHKAKAWCEINVNVPWLDEVLEDMKNRFPSEEGYHIEILVATEERRIIDYTDKGPQVLMREPIFLRQ